MSKSSTQSVRQVPHLIVDGYNLIHAWRVFRKILSEYGHAAVQSRLLDTIAPIHDSEGWRITLVFDGNQQRAQIDTPLGAGGIAVIYASAQMAADGVIERLLVQSRVDERVAVVSRDGAITRLAYSLNKEVVGPQELEAWLARIAQEGHQRTLRDQHTTPKTPPDPAWNPLVELRKHLVKPQGRS
ncbi:MAG: hypothetical protein B7X06_01240 [Verrucomicrobia bacterium 21-51-4]|nr:MAG: hypothetical protein B7X06_01240 [Verrucomicrobia bacterium 21-51-4]HQU08438.1 NYN domain-containing protein [Opitutales bacterium]